MENDRPLPQLFTPQFDQAKSAEFLKPVKSRLPKQRGLAVYHVGLKVYDLNTSGYKKSNGDK
jgi:hypothetical protein